MNKQRAALLSIISNSLLVLLKVFAGVLMGSISVISEAAHSAIDLVASCVAYFSIRKALEPADQQHPFGHGKFENVSGFFEAILILIAGGMIIYESINKIFHPVEVMRLDWGIGVMLISVLVNITISQILFRVSKKTRSIALEADAMHLRADVLTSLSVMIGLAIIKITHWGVLDPLIAITVAVLICRASISLTRRSIRDLVDERLPDSEVEAIRRIIHSFPAVIGYHKLRTRKSGNQREIDLHLTMEKNTAIAEAHETCDGIEAKIRRALPGTHITIHVEPDHR